MAGTTGRLIAVAATMLSIGATTASGPATALAGRYSRSFQNGTVDGERYRSDDVVEIVPIDPTHAYIRLALAFFNGHSCALSGVAIAEGNALVTRVSVDDGDGEQCRLGVRRAGTVLRWADGGTCRAYCGVRGSFNDGDLPWASRRPIRYLARLKASHQYRDALNTNRNERSVRP